MSSFPAFLKIKASCLSRLMNSRVKSILFIKKIVFHYFTSALDSHIHLVTSCLRKVLLFWWTVILRSSVVLFSIFPTISGADHRLLRCSPPVACSLAFGLFPKILGLFQSWKMTLWAAVYGESWSRYSMHSLVLRLFCAAPVENWIRLFKPYAPIF